MFEKIKKASVAAVAVLAVVGCVAPPEILTDGGPPTVRRLTAEQYRQSITDIFGENITVAGRFEPDVRVDGLIAIGTAQVTVTPSGFEQYNSIGRNIAAQVVSEEHRDRLIGCKPVSLGGADDACVREVLGRIGRLLYRRPLTEVELDNHTDIARAATAKLGGFYEGLEFAIAGLLVAPEFLFRVEATVPNGRELDAYSKATRLSFFLWNAPPDAELLNAAARGDLNNTRGLAVQVDRLLNSDRVADGVRAFFADMLGFEEFDKLAKDSTIYPAFSLRVANDSREQALRTITHHLIDLQGDYRDLFTTRRTFLTRALGAVYRVPVGVENGWEPYEFGANDPRAGIITQIGFVGLHSHPGRSSATLRGMAVRELLMCQKVPLPPNNVDFSVVQDTDNPIYKTARDRLTAHRSEPMCAGCHKITDPIGLALENFDGLGQFRDTENGIAIDASGDLEGKSFRNAAELGQVLSGLPATVSCVVDNTYRYAVGRMFAPGESSWRSQLIDDFSENGYNFTYLLRRIALSSAFYRIGEVENMAGDKYSYNRPYTIETTQQENRS
ncbi:MAG: hypothetical protein CMG46_03820 [Candidatus Marinimicrobia bacterium]|nr:hypothetical protein [Candidatus Neomarinimicrobiota bacterium]